jgi:hypothetical protein
MAKEENFPGRCWLVNLCNPCLQLRPKLSAFFCYEYAFSMPCHCLHSLTVIINGRPGAGVISVAFTVTMHDHINQ